MALGFPRTPVHTLVHAEPQDPLPVGQGLLEQRNSLRGSACGLVGKGEVIPRGQGSGVVGAQDPLPVGYGLLKQRDGLSGSADLPIGGGEVISRA